MAYEITWLERTVIIKLTGSVSIHELHAVNQAISGSAKFDNIRKRIFDCSEGPVIEVTPADLKIFAYVDNAAAKSNPHIHVAIVTTDLGLLKNSHDYQSAAEQFLWEVKTFATMQDAVDWKPQD